MSLSPVRSLLASFALFASLATVACSMPSQNDAPILDSVDAPLAVTAQNGSWSIPLTILFHDNDREVITHVRYRVGTSFDRVVEIPTPNPTRESAELTIVVPQHACRGLDQPAIELSVIDSRGAESRAVPRVVTLN